MCGQDIDCVAQVLGRQVVLTRSTGAEMCLRVGELARAVSQVADEFGVCWETIMNAVVEHGTPLVDDPGRVGPDYPAQDHPAQRRTHPPQGAKNGYRILGTETPIGA